MNTFIFTFRDENGTVITTNIVALDIGYASTEFQNTFDYYCQFIKAEIIND
jgi:hypothetical protein